MSTQSKFVFFLGLGLSASSHAQMNEQTVAIDRDGTVYRAGKDLATVSKTGAWQIQLSENPRDSVRALGLRPDGSIYAAGTGFVAKLSPSGVRLAWLPIDAVAQAVAADGTGSIYLGGAGFLEKLDAAGKLLSRIDLGSETLVTGIAVDGSGPAYLTGTTTSLDLLFARNRRDGVSDAFVAKTNPTGDAIEWSAYIGGPGAGRRDYDCIRTQGSHHYRGLHDFSRLSGRGRWKAVARR